MSEEWIGKLWDEVAEVAKQMRTLADFNLKHGSDEAGDIGQTLGIYADRLAKALYWEDRTQLAEWEEAHAAVLAAALPIPEPLAEEAKQ